MRMFWKSIYELALLSISEVKTVHRWTRER